MFIDSGRSPKNHPVGWNRKWQNCHMNFHQIRWSYHHLNYHQFWQIPPKITIMSDIKSDKIFTRIVTKFGDIFVTSILTISGSSPKNHHIGWNNKWQNRHPKCHQIWWQFCHLNSHQFGQFTEIFTRMGDNPAENPIENVLGLLPSQTSSFCMSPSMSLRIVFVMDNTQRM